MTPMFRHHGERDNLASASRLLVVDGASARRAKSLRVPERITLVSLPAYTSELNPAERLWPLVREGVANRTHETLAPLEEAVCGRCQRITGAQVTTLTNYHWWPAA